MLFSMYPLNHGLTKMSIHKAQSIGMTGFQQLCITATQAYFRAKMAQSVGTTGIEGIFLRYRGSGRRPSRGEGRSGGRGSALKRRSPTVITILKHTRKNVLLQQGAIGAVSRYYRGICSKCSKTKSLFYYTIYYGQTKL